MVVTGVADQPVASVRDRLVQVAARLFAEKGFEATTVRQIVETAGVTKGGLYHYFDSKDALLYEIYSRMLRMQASRMETIADSGLALPQRIHAIIADVVATSIANLDDAVVFFQSMHLLEAEKQADVRAERRRYHERFRSLVEEGQRDGVFRADVPADIVVNYHFGAIHRLGMWYHPDGAFSGEQVGLYFANLMLGSLLPPTTSAA
ncbi:TetR/AcrR family transcriptional regulator [Amycolatopsis sp.]|jgi:AcrR family transcriptional regulator|uniref:TetR/AcrR family transcriptional regulator n=1 Tax=Amycolatopsis sp. TaxID=37632 RepID=UPI002E07F518|nr:TetR/AcrR family transcriptional regulator [Amycolatopsis sp.]